METRFAEPGLFMTIDTKSAYMPQVIEGLERSIVPGDHVIITSPRDFNENGEPSESLKTLFNNAGYSEFYVASLTHNFGDDPSAARALASPSRYSEEQWASIAQLGEYADPEDVKADWYSHYKDNACSITMPSYGDISDTGYAIASPAGMSEAVLQAHPSRLQNENIPGTTADLSLWVGHHEIDHCNNVGDKYYEYRSDTYANKQYAADLRDGLASDPELPYAMRSMRAGAAIMGTSGDAYITNGLSPLAGEQPLTEGQLDTAYDQVLEAQARIYGDIQFERDIRHETLLDPNNSRMNARLAYQHGKNLLEEGMFDDIPYGKTTVERFIDGAERYGHEFYNVQREDMRTTPPEMPIQAYGHSMPTFAQGMDVQRSNLLKIEF